MGIAISALHGMFTPVAGLLAWLAGEDSRRTAHARTPQTPRAPAEARACQVGIRLPRGASGAPAARRQPLRVFRLAEPGSPTGGRLVISGRMADVCAELDRLAALEAARH